MKLKKLQSSLLAVFIFLSYNGQSQTKTNNEGILTIQGLTGSVSEINNLSTGTITNDGNLYVYNHYNNNGIVSFTTGVTTGMTRMKGLFGFQNISGSSQMKWYDCEFDNALIQPAFHLSNQVNISGSANFFQGIVDDDNFGGLLLFENLSNHFNVDDQSHVDGFVRKNGNENFRFPIGDGQQYRYASISNPTIITDAFTGKFFWDNSDLLYPHANREPSITLIDNAEYWTIDKTQGNSSTFLTLTWDVDTTPIQIYNTPYEEIHIVRWDVVQNKWIDEGGVADASTNEVTTVINPLTNYGVFTLARVKNTLLCNGNSILVHNIISANNDTVNDTFTINGIEDCPNNKLEIYNRWGVKVYETRAYNSVGNVFNGYSQGRSTVNPDGRLPFGTYFYFLEITDDVSGIASKFSGYLFLY